MRAMEQFQGRRREVAGERIEREREGGGMRNLQVGEREREKGGTR